MSAEGRTMNRKQWEYRLLRANDCLGCVFPGRVHNGIGPRCPKPRPSVAVAARNERGGYARSDV